MVLLGNGTFLTECVYTYIPDSVGVTATAETALVPASHVDEPLLLLIWLGPNVRLPVLHAERLNHGSGNSISDGVNRAGNSIGELVLQVVEPGSSLVHWARLNEGSAREGEDG